MRSVVRNDEFEMGFNFEPTMPSSGRHKPRKDKTSFFYESIHQFDSDVNIKEVFVKPSVTLNGSEVIIGSWVGNRHVNILQLSISSSATCSLHTWNGRASFKIDQLGWNL